MRQRQNGSNCCLFRQIQPPSRETEPLLRDCHDDSARIVGKNCQRESSQDRTRDADPDAPTDDATKDIRADRSR
jgi:hypothetical protein